MCLSFEAPALTSTMLGTVHKGRALRASTGVPAGSGVYDWPQVKPLRAT